ncbi:hypothetical protein [Limnobacter sp.]|uniref:hypothetical protein n=1 Tax=Limnobacter sp. TaxID=2003368 RepID=UPI003514E619
MTDPLAPQASPEPTGLAIDDSGAPPSSGAAKAQKPLDHHERTQMMNYLQHQRGLTAEQAERFLDEFMQPDEVRQFLSVISGQTSITRQDMKEKWGLSDEEIDFVLQGEESLSMRPADGEGRHGAVLVTSHPFGNIFVEFMALMYALGTDVRQMITKMIKVQKDGMIDSANEQFRGAIAKFSAAMFAGVVSLGGGAFNALNTKNKPPSDPSQNAGTGKTGNESTNSRNARLNDAMNNTWTSPQGLALITQPFSATGEFLDAFFQREAGRSNAEVEEARAIFQQLMSFYEQTNHAQQSAAQGAG